MDSSLALFLLYTLVVLAIAWWYHCTRAKKAFLSEYFLGIRGLGMIALALTFGATSASAGSFAGFPSLIYAHGWVLALWIASYMIFPLCGMGLLGKRLNYVARTTGAITVPDVLRERFESPALALVSTVLMALLLTVYLVPQFTLATLIMEQLLGGAAPFQHAAMGLASIAPGLMPAGVSTEYVLGLLLFAVLVVAYTAFGGFRAVVWTDVLQGFVMIIGVMVILVLALWQVGGLPAATTMLQEMTPPRLGEAYFESDAPAPASGHRISADTWFTDGTRLMRTNQSAFILRGETRSAAIKVVEITTPQEIDRIMRTAPPALPATPHVTLLKEYASGAGETGAYVRARTERGQCGRLPAVGTGGVFLRLLGALGHRTTGQHGAPYGFFGHGHPQASHRLVVRVFCADLFSAGDNFLLRARAGPGS